MNVDRRTFQTGVSTLSSVGKTLLIFTVLMITLPVSMYFITKSMIFEGMFLMNSRNSSFYGAIVAVIIVHVILACFIYISYFESSQETEKED
ncbi:vacuolar ATPase assembly integral membrane protein VMA21-like [Antedon mediterranea]|uniref:vacuolar ATPase assembly integral membrane protein VMA21-like n=1 Tax=Antedon mediterranea TaxID=105859 RepID=UPI003AF49294